MDPWLPLIAGLVGTVLGGGIAYLNSSLQWKRQRTTERNRFLLGKLEEICKVVIEIEVRLRGVSSETALRLSDGGQTRIAKETADAIPLEEMHMLVSLYFESLVPHAKAVVEGRERVGSRLAETFTKRPKTSTEYEARLTEAFQSFDYAKANCESFLAEAARIAKGIV